MEYGTKINEDYAIINQHQANDSYVKYVAYDQTDCGTRKFFSKKHINLISSKVTQLLMGVDHKNRPIIVPDTTIESVMSSVFNSYIPEDTGIIHNKIVSSNKPYSCTQQLTDQVIEIIVNDVKNNLGMEECNRKLSIWDSILGDFNKHGLMPHSHIKLNNRKPPLQFNMNY
jgi:hypothetical protein